MTDLVLDRLEAWRTGDQGTLARIDARAPKDARSLAALWSAAFEIAERSLNVLAVQNPSAAADVLEHFRVKSASTGPGASVGSVQLPAKRR